MTNKLNEERILRADVRDINFHGRRITNASPSKNPDDYVIRRELDAFTQRAAPIAQAALVIQPQARIKFVNFSMGGTLVVGQRITPKPPISLRSENTNTVIQCRAIRVQGNLDVAGTERSVFDVLVQPADEAAARYSILPPFLGGKLIIPPNTLEQTILEAGDLGSVTTFLDGDFFTIDAIEAGTGAANAHVLVTFVY